MTTRISVHNEATLRARHKEALDIHKAWVDRHRNTGGNEARAVKMQMDDAWAWVETTADDLATYRQATRHKMREYRKVCR